MGRLIIGIVAGIVAALACILLVQFVGHQIYPVGEFSLRDEEAVAAMIASLPVGALLFVVAAWLLGAMVGGAVAARLTGRTWAAWLIGALVAVAGIANVMMYPHPVWMQVAAVVAPAVGGLLGGHLAGRRTAAA